MASDSDDEMKRELERLRAENETLKQNQIISLLKLDKKVECRCTVLAVFPSLYTKANGLYF